MARKITKRLSNERAFTLIEVIVSLVLAGIMAAVVGLGLVKITQGYVFAKQNSETVQKAQIAMTRIVKELGAIEPQSGTATAITTAGTTSISYTRREPIGSSTFISNTISISGGYAYLNLNQTGNGTLINNVVTGSSSFAYFDAAGNTLSAPVTMPAKIRRIEINLSVTGASNQTSNFTNSVWINESY
jgi:prepilin-type N-terminal cleavage/methylation domain-containing protein